MGRVIISDGAVFNREAKERRQRPKYKAYDYKEILGNIHTAGSIAKQATDVLSSPLVKGVSGSQSPLVKPFRGSPTATPGGTAMDQAVAQRAQAAGNVPFAVNEPVPGGYEAPWSEGIPKAPPPGPSLTPEQQVSIDRGQQVSQAAQTSIQAQKEAEQAMAALAQPQTLISPQIGQPAQPAKPASLVEKITASHDPIWQRWAVEGRGTQPRHAPYNYSKALRTGISIPSEEIQVWIQEAAGPTARIYSQDASELAHLATAIQQRETGSGVGHDKNGVFGPYKNDPGAISVTGPVGLFQFNQKTWREAAKRAGAPEDLGGRLDPELATAVAVDHLGYLLQRAGGDINKAAQLYHGTAADQITNPLKYGNAVAAEVNKLAAETALLSVAEPAAVAPETSPDAPAAEQQVATSESAEASSQQERVQPNPPIEQASIAPPGFEDRETEIRAGTFVVPNVRPDVVSANSLQLMSFNATDQRQKNWVRQLAFEADQKGELNYEFTDYMDLFSGKARDRFMKRLEGGMPAAVKPREPVSDLDRSTAELRRAQAKMYRAEAKLKAKGPKKEKQKPYDYNGNLATVTALKTAFVAQVEALKTSLKTRKPVAINGFEAKFPASVNATKKVRDEMERVWRSAYEEIQDIRSITNLRNNDNRTKIKDAEVRLSRKLILIKQLIATIGKSRTDSPYTPTTALSSAWDNVFSSTGGTRVVRGPSQKQKRKMDKSARKTDKAFGD